MKFLVKEVSPFASEFCSKYVIAFKRMASITLLFTCSFHSS